jgi:hypothetical protein
LTVREFDFEPTKLYYRAHKGIVGSIVFVANS